MNPNSWILTNSKKRFDFNDIKTQDISILDIAHSLSMQCRFNGHCKTFYSVAEHSLFMSNLLSEIEGNTKELQLFALLHDAAECYIGDMPRPLKQNDDFFNDIEQRVMIEVEDRFSLEPTFDQRQLITWLDQLVCCYEIQAPQLLDDYLSIEKSQEQFPDLPWKQLLEEYIEDDFTSEHKILWSIRNYIEYDIDQNDYEDNPYKDLFKCYEPMEARERFLTKYLKLTEG